MIVDGHSFPSDPLPHEPYQRAHRPDICIGTDSLHTPARLTETLKYLITSAGLTVKIDSPFSGPIVPLEYYQKESAVHSVMI